MLLAGSRSLSARATRVSTERAGRLSRGLGWMLLILIAFLLVEVLFEAWVQVRLADRVGIDANGNQMVVLPEWPKTLKNGLYLTLLVLTAAKILVDRRWRDFLTYADIAFAVLAVVLVLAGLAGDSSPRLIGAAAYVYLRGAIVFYAWRAADPSWRRIRPVFIVVGVLVGVNALIAIAQTILGYDSFRALGWVNLSWARINRAHALLDHPNHLGHLLALTLLGLLAWFVTRPATWWWWFAFGTLALALSATQSRESLIGFVAAAIVIALLRRGGWPIVRVVATALVLVIGFSGAQLAFSPSNRAEVQRRLAGVLSAFHVGSGQEGDDFCVEGNAGCAEDNPNKIPQREVRVLYAQQGAKLWMKRPLLGYGVGQFGGIVASENDPRWYADPRFGPDGFKMYGFAAQQVDSFWLHLLVETGTVGSVVYLGWLALLVAPFVVLALRRRTDRGGRTDRGDRTGHAGRAPPQHPPLHPVAYWAPAAVVFGALIAFFAASLEDPIFPALLFTVLGVGWVLLRRGELQPAMATDGTAATEGAAAAAGERPPATDGSPSATDGGAADSSGSPTQSSQSSMRARTNRD